MPLFVSLSIVLLMFLLGGALFSFPRDALFVFVAVFIVKSCSLCASVLLFCLLFKPSLGRELEGILCPVYRFLMACFMPLFLVIFIPSSFNHSALS